MWEEVSISKALVFTPSTTAPFLYVQQQQQQHQPGQRQQHLVRPRAGTQAPHRWDGRKWRLKYLLAKARAPRENDLWLIAISLSRAPADWKRKQKTPRASGQILEQAKWPRGERTRPQQQQQQQRQLQQQQRPRSDISNNFGAQEIRTRIMDCTLSLRSRERGRVFTGRVKQRSLTHTHSLMNFSTLFLSSSSSPTPHPTF